MNNLYNSTNFVVRLRGLPWNTTHNEIQSFLQGCKIRQIEFLKNDQGRSTGECFVVLESKTDMDSAMAADKKMLGNRYIEVFETNMNAMHGMIKPQDHNTDNNNDWQEPVVRLRGLPYNATREDVSKFFDGLDIAQNGVYISSSKPAGEAFVAFTTMDNALRALEFNRMNMGHRYIEIFKATYSEARSSIINDTQPEPRKKGSNQNPRQNDGKRNKDKRKASHNLPQNNPPTVPLPPSPIHTNIPVPASTPMVTAQAPVISNDYDPYAAENNNDYQPDNAQTTSYKRPLPVQFTIRMRGVPFEAGEQEIYDFYHPVVPIRLEKESAPRGRPPVWFAEFGSREEATEAMTFHKKYLGLRYIELFPLYDELNRTK